MLHQPLAFATARTRAVRPNLDRIIAATLPAALGIAARVVTHERHPWASASFVGARHRIALASDEAGADDVARLAARLDAFEWRLPGWIVADTRLERGADIGGQARWRAELLLVADN